MNHAEVIPLQLTVARKLVCGMRLRMRRRLRLHLSHLTATTACVIVLGVTMQLAMARVLTQWEVLPFQPNIREGGRADMIAVHPLDNNIIFVASSTGGLFRSVDRGLHWMHVESLPAYGNAVGFLPADPNVLVATARPDYHVNNYGGIWRSSDGGVSWAQVPNPSAPSGVTLQPGAGEISFAPDAGTIYVATNYGVAVSTNGGSKFDYTFPFTGKGEATAVVAVIALHGNVILAGGPQGVRRSTDGGATWAPPATSPGTISDMHAFGRSPLVSNQAYVVNDRTDLFYTEDGGQNWKEIASAPEGYGGGIAFVRPIRAISQPNQVPTLDLYFSDHTYLHKLRCPPISGTNRFDYSGNWVTLNVDHPDMRDLAFDANQQPILLASDGGLHNTTDGGLTWSLVGGGANGFNALQITEIKGQWIENAYRFDMYFGTQDNSFWASSDNGISWSHWGNEGGGIEAWRRVPTEANSTITLDDAGYAKIYVSGPMFSSLQPWISPPERIRGSLIEGPKLIAPSTHVQAVNTSYILVEHPPQPSHPVLNFHKGFVVTTTRGADWDQYVELPENLELLDLPKLSINGASPPQPVLYQAIRTGWPFLGAAETIFLARIAKNSTGNGATVSYPAMNQFGGLGFNNTMFAWYIVFGVDPVNPNYLIAPDVVNDKMMITTDGGNNWTEHAQLTSLVIDDGQFTFKRDRNIPHASVISFCPENPDMIAVGTWQGGILISSDHGVTWSRVPDSEKITRITAVEWRTAGEFIVSTYGRGLWRVRLTMVCSKLDFTRYCLGCKAGPPSRRLRDLVDPMELLKSRDAILIFDGNIQGVRTSEGVVREVFVSPGSSASIFSESRSPLRIKFTETTKWIGFPSEPSGEMERSARDSRLVGLLVDTTCELTNAVFSDTILSARKVVRHDLPPATAVSPILGKPYVRLGSGGGQTLFLPSESIPLSGTGFPARARLEILVDNTVVTKAAVGRNGAFSSRVAAPRQHGVHSITVRRTGSDRPLDGVSFLVRNRDIR